jgi:hypothetical protein
MTVWTAVVLALSEPDGGPMVSRLPSYLHPVAGRPLIWHTVNSLALRDVPPTDVLVVAPDLTAESFDGVPLRVTLGSDTSPLDLASLESNEGDGPIVMVHASAALEPEGLRRLVGSRPGAWLGDGAGLAAAISIRSGQLPEALRHPQPFSVASDVLAPAERVEGGEGCTVIRTRSDLAGAHRRIRDQLVRGLMEAGVTFLLPESVMVDVDVRIGRDSMVYPGVVLEGQTTVGEETVIGPGCRIIDSWIGSGVELKGWNYVAHTSVRNRAILEPYVRRGFD